MATPSEPMIMTFNDPTGKTVSDKGKYVTVWKKQKDGSWKVLLDVFNTDLPPTGAS
jgi:ketosteroid isomerase-like protein